MTRKESKIMDIMTELNVDHDVAEQLFLDELDERYSDLTGDLEVMETLFEKDSV